MKNVVLTYSPDRTQLTITIDLTKTFGRSASGKTTIIATTEGNVKIERPEGGETHLGVNCYTK